MSDENIWNMIGGDKNYCSFKMKTDTISLCRNKYNVTGICDRISCPLANSKYATVREEDGKLYIFMKEPERNNTPSLAYEKVEIQNFDEIDEILKYFNKEIIHRCKQRYIKLIKYLERKQEILREGLIQHVAKRKKQLKIERSRGNKEFMKLNIRKCLEEELLERMKMGMYGDGIIKRLKDASLKQNLLKKTKKGKSYTTRVKNDEREENDRDSNKIKNKDVDVLKW